MSDNEDWDLDDLPEGEDSQHEWWDFEDEAEMVDAVAGDIGFIIESALDARGQALIALPGTDEATAVFEKLAERKIRWKDVTIVPTDDRLVAVSDELSIIAKIAKIFIPLGARVLPISSENEDYQMAGNAADARLQDLHWPLDLCWLGMDENGHAASILPGPDFEDALEGPAEKRALGIMPEPMPADAPVARVSITAASVASARTVMVTIAGSAQRPVLEAAIQLGEVSDSSIGRIFNKLAVPVDIYWLDN